MTSWVKPPDLLLPTSSSPRKNVPGYLIWKRNAGTNVLPTTGNLEETINAENAKEKLEKFDGIIVPGGFGNRGIEGKIQTVKYARENNEKYQDKIVPVLIEGYSDKGGKLMGYTDTMKLVNVVGDSSNIGSIVPVRITEVKTWSMEGEVVSDRK